MTEPDYKQLGYDMAKETFTENNISKIQNVLIGEKSDYLISDRCIDQFVIHLSHTKLFFKVDNIIYKHVKHLMHINVEQYSNEYLKRSNQWEFGYIEYMIELIENMGIVIKDDS